MSERDDYHRYGSFGRALYKAIGGMVAELTALKDDDDLEAFLAKIAEIEETVHRLFARRVRDFTDALAGYLAFNGVSEHGKIEETISEATVSMATNGHKVLAEIFRCALPRAEDHLRETVARGRETQIMDQVFADLMNLDAWDVTVGEHPLADLFRTKKEDLQA
jgi:hypothetical protein